MFFFITSNYRLFRSAISKSTYGTKRNEWRGRYNRNYKICFGYIITVWFYMQVNIDYPSGRKQFPIGTPWRRKAIKTLTRRSYSSMATTIVSSRSTSIPVISSIVRQVKKEIRKICSDTHDTVLRDSIEAVKCFSWETIWLELEQNLPTLITLLKSLVKFPERNKPLLCFLASCC